MNRQSGILLPIFSLPGDYGCGTFGASAYRWIDLLSESGFSLWQLLPLGICDKHNSPYASCSSFSGNPYFIDPDEIFGLGLVSKDELDKQRSDSVFLCDYELLRERRFEFLKTAALRVKDRSNIQEFISKNPRIAASCEFLAKKQLYGSLPHTVRNDMEISPDELFAWQFIQYEFHREWQQLHEYAKKKGVRIIGDIPFYVSLDSYDVFSSPEQFLLDGENIPTEVSGVPPDSFSSDGQLWGTPIYNWKKMETDGYSYWRERLGYMLNMFDGIRIDHFRAISAYWSIPYGAVSAKDGAWKRGPGKKLIDALADIVGDKLIFAENLGVIDDEVSSLLKYSGYYGMAVFQFGFDGEADSPHLPHNYSKDTVAYSGTHDNNTLLGFLLELDARERRRVLDYLGSPSDACEGAISTLMMSVAQSVIFPIQDILGYGADTRINTPGTAFGNWRYRVTEPQLESIDRGRYYYLNKIYSRK